MTSLNTCLKKAGDRITQDDKDFIFATARDYKGDGETGTQAAIHAVDDLIGMAVDERAKLVKQIEARGGVVPALVEEEPSEPATPAIAEEDRFDILNSFNPDTIEQHSGLKDAKIMEEIRTMAAGAGWAERGGHLLRDAEGNVTGRSAWLPREEWFADKPKGITETDFKQAVERLDAKRKLTKKHRNAVAFMLSYINDRSMNEFDDTGIDEFDEISEFDKEIVALAVELDELEAYTGEAILERSSEKGWSNADTRRALKDAIRENRSEGVGGEESIGEGRDEAQEPESTAEAKVPELELTGQTQEEIARQTEADLEAEEKEKKKQVDREAEHYGLESQVQDNRSAESGDLLAGLGKAETKQAKPLSSTEDVGGELTKNRRQKGISLEDLKSEENDAKRVLLAQKSKLWARPDYQEMVDNGTHPLIAHNIKQIYDSIATKPSDTLDATLFAYAEGIEAIRKAVDSFLGDKSAIAAMVSAMAEPSKRMLADGGKDYMLDLVFPKNEEGSRWGRKNAAGNDRAIALGGKVHAAISPSLKSFQKAVSAVNEGWPTKQESWQRTYRVKNRDDAAKVSYADFRDEKAEGKPTWVKKHYVDIDGRRGAKFDTKAEAEAAIKDLPEWYLLKKKYSTVIATFDTQAEAVDAARDLVKKTRVEAFKEPKTSPEKSVREGQDLRDGKNVSTQDLQNVVGFKAINFGNWMKGPSKAKERQAHVNSTYDAMHDMAELLNVPVKAMSLNGMLGLAIGAQGTGGSRAAAAHFVPGVNEINLTRDHGAGSLAHEWAHGLDHYFAVQAGLAKQGEPFLSVFKSPAKDSDIRPEIVDRFNTIVKAMKEIEKEYTKEEIDKKRSELEAIARRQLDGWLKSAAPEKTSPKYAGLLKKIKSGDVGKYEQLGKSSNQVGANINALREEYKKLTGHYFGLDVANGIHTFAKSVGRTQDTKEYHAKHPKSRNIRTNYYKSARSMETVSGKPYWSTPWELFARAFETYVQAKLADQDGRNTYLTAGWKGETEGLFGDEAVKWFPQGIEQEHINNAFDGLIQELKTKETDQGVAMYSRGGASPAFYSELTRQVEALRQPKAKADQWAGMIRNLSQKGVKKEEVIWSGVEEWLNGGYIEARQDAAQIEAQIANSNKGELAFGAIMAGEAAREAASKNKTITKEELLDYLRSQEVSIRENESQRAPKIWVVRENNRPESENNYFESQEEAEDFVIDMENSTIVKSKWVVSEEDDPLIIDTKYSEWQMEGKKEGYRELLMMMPPAKGEVKVVPHPDIKGSWALQHPSGEYVRKAGAIIMWDRKDYAEKYGIMAHDKSGAYRSAHWDEANVVAHIRFNERTIGGKRTMFVEEVQSDWAQAGREKGYREPRKLDWIANDDGTLFTSDNLFVELDPSGKWFAYDDTGANIGEHTTLEKAKKAASTYKPQDTRITNQPFKHTETWAMLGMKRAIRWAAENGFNQVAWAPGEVQAERYSGALRNSVDRIEWTKTDAGIYLVGTKNESEVVNTTEKETALSDAIGKSMGDRIIDDPNQSGVIEGDNITISDTGMAGFYDKILPKAVGKFVKRFGSKVGVSKTDGQEVWSFPVTAKMRESAMGGFPMFKQGEKTKGKSTVSQVKDWLDKPLSKLGKWVNVEVVQSADQLSGNAPADARGMFLGDTVYLVADNITKTDAQTVLAHEVVGHLGIETLLGARAFDQLTRQIQNMKRQGNKQVLAAIEVLKQNYTDADGNYTLDEKQESREILAYLAETNPKFGIVRSMLAKLRLWLAQHGFGDFDRTMLESLLVRAARHTEAEYSGFMEAPGGRHPAYSYLGPKSKTADQSALNRAVQMEQEGASQESIREQTGWFLGMDDKWRYEINDKDYFVKKNPVAQAGKPGIPPHYLLGDLIEHPELFEAYPELRKLKVETTERGGYFNPKKGTIGAAKGDRGDTLIHEIQHAIQYIEGFARGMNAADATREKSGQDSYKRSAGEIEARDAAMRRWMTDKARMKMQPYKGQGIAREDAIVRFRGGTEISQSIDITGELVAYSRSGASPEDPLNQTDWIGRATMDAVNDTIRGYKSDSIGKEVVEKFGFWDKFIGTMDNLMRRNPEITGFFETSKRMRMDQDETFSKTNDAVKAFNRLPRQQRKRLTDALYDGTTYKDPRYSEGAQGIVWSDDTLQKAYQLNDAGVAAYHDIQGFFGNLTQEYLDRLLERMDLTIRDGAVVTMDTEAVANLEGEVALLSETIEGEPDGEARDSMVARRKVLRGQITRLDNRVKLGEKIVSDFKRLRGYFPLMRYGQHTVSVRNKKGELVHFEQSESVVAQKRAAGRLRQRFGEDHTVDVGRLQQFAGDALALDPRIMSMLQSYVEEAPEIVDEIEQAILKSYAEQSFRKRFIHRQGMPGYSRDVRRAIASYGWSSSNFLAKMRYIPKLQADEEKLSKHKYPQIKEHLKRQIEYLSNPGEEFAPFKSFVFAAYMGLNLKSAVVNLTQIPMTLYPHLAAKYNDAKAVSAISKAMAAATHPDTVSDPRLKKLLKWAEVEGITMDMYLSDLVGMARGSMLAKAKLQSNVMEAMTFMFSTAERFNRRVSVAAAYYIDQNVSDDQVKINAEKVTRTTQFDYGKHNRGRMFRGFGGIPLQFQQFTVNFLQFLAGNGGGAGATARALGVLFVAAGIMGMPGFDDLRAAFELAWQKITGKHLDMELEARKWLVDSAEEFVSKPDAQFFADTILRGSRAWSPANITGSLSTSRLIPGLSRALDIGATEGLKRGLESSLTGGSLGPGVGLLTNALRGVDEYTRSGDFWRFAERALPLKAAQYAMKAIRVSKEGVDRDYSGRVRIAYEPDALDIVLQSLSFQPSERSRLYEISNAERREGEFLKLAHNKLLTRLALAISERDQAKIRAARMAIKAWNLNSPREWILPSSKVSRSMKARGRMFNINKKTGRGTTLKQLQGKLNRQREDYFGV